MAPIPIPLSSTSQISKRVGPLIPILIRISTLSGVAGAATETIGVVLQTKFMLIFPLN